MGLSARFWSWVRRPPEKDADELVRERFCRELTSPRFRRLLGLTEKDAKTIRLRMSGREMHWRLARNPFVGFAGYTKPANGKLTAAPPRELVLKYLAAQVRELQTLIDSDVRVDPVDVVNRLNALRDRVNAAARDPVVVALPYLCLPFTGRCIAAHELIHYLRDHSGEMRFWREHGKNRDGIPELPDDERRAEEAVVWRITFRACPFSSVAFVAFLVPIYLGLLYGAYRLSQLVFS